ncbi:ATP-dependent DNA helicase pfh1 [Leucoagaricus sp. SymC.cos]|nr:ATP-dependent DNA helicase pfh1 [Leucoagaricus sp. SymC.cos]
MSKPRSGLGTLRRDWSNASASAASCSSQLIEWEPTPPKKQEPTKEQLKTERSNKRLLAIKQALTSINNSPAQPQSSTPPPVSQSIAPSRTTGKRPSIDSADTAPSKKRRELPPSWRDDLLSDPSISRSTSSSTLKSTDENRSRYWGSGNGSGDTGEEKKFSASVASSSASSSSSTSTKVNKVAKIFLSQEQTHILKLVKEGNSIFYTGSAGTGKSVLLREIIKTMKNVHSRTPEAVAITASTGIAACNIGGVTIHSFAGVGLGVETAEKLVDKIKKNKKALMRWMKCKVLIIDEGLPFSIFSTWKLWLRSFSSVSMVDGELFDKLANVGSILRKRPSEPFGGIQLVVTGDFFQLPPVNKAGMSVKFAFEAEHWYTTIKRTFNLTKVFRQKDQEFVDMLNEMRFGRLSSKSIARFKSLSRNIIYEDGLGPTELFPRREDVEKANGMRMQRLRTQELKFLSTDGGTLTDPDHRNKMLSNFMAPKELRLRIDAQVMLIKNVDEQLVNGTMGRVIQFIDPATYTLETGYDTANGAGATNAIPKKSATGVCYPLVEFSIANGGPRTVLVTPETWKVELPNGEVQVSRVQLPLILAWAMSIHKSQGQTLDRVKVDLSRVFEKGQAYVALSRATSLEGLQVLNFEPNKVHAHEKVAKWSLTLETISDAS